MEELMKIFATLQGGQVPTEVIAVGGGMYKIVLLRTDVITPPSPEELNKELAAKNLEFTVIHSTPDPDEMDMGVYFEPNGITPPCLDDLDQEAGLP